MLSHLQSRKTAFTKRTSDNWGGLSVNEQLEMVQKGTFPDEALAPLLQAILFFYRTFPLEADSGKSDAVLTVEIEEMIQLIKPCLIDHAIGL